MAAKIKTKIVPSTTLSRSAVFYAQGDFHNNRAAMFAHSLEHENMPGRRDPGRIKEFNDAATHHIDVSISADKNYKKLLRGTEGTRGASVPSNSSRDRMFEGVN